LVLYRGRGRGIKKKGGIIFLFLQFPITEGKEEREGREGRKGKERNILHC